MSSALGCSSVWSERVVWDHEAHGSNPCIPTIRHWQRILVSVEASGLGNPRQLKCRPGGVRTARGWVRDIDHRARGVRPVSDTGNGEFDSHMVNWWAVATRVTDNKAGRQVVAGFATLVDAVAAFLGIRGIWPFDSTLIAG